MIKTISVVIHQRRQTGTDRFHAPIYEDVTETVSGCLPISPSTEAVTSDETLYSKHLAYVLCLPKGDTHDWSAGTVVELFGARFKTYGDVIEYVEANIPWGINLNKQAKLERYT